MTSAVLLASAACSSPSFSPGVDGSKVLSELSGEDKKQLCTALQETTEDFVNSNKDGVCKLGAILVALLSGDDPQAVCEMAVTTCSNNDVDGSDERAACESSMAITGCSATVDEMEACYNEKIEALGELYDELAAQSCAELLMDSGMDSQGTKQPEEPAACVALEAKCPGVAGLAFGTTGTSTKT